MIESLQSPHVARVKALLSSKKDRTESKLFVAEGIQGVREALLIEGEVETLYLTKSGAERMAKAGVDYSFVNVVEVADKVADAMSDAITGQGIVAFVILRGGIDHANGETLVKELRDHVAKEIGAIAKPRQIMVVNELPKTRSGKIMRRLLKDVAENRAVGDATTLADPNVMKLIAEGLQSATSED